MYCSQEPYDRVFIELGPFPVYWYGFLIMMGAVIALIVATREAKRLGLHKDFFIDLLVFAIPAAIVGARLYYVIFELDRYDSFMEMIDIREGGLAIHGALIASVAVAYVYAKYKKVSFWKIADIAAPSLLIGQMLGRWGNFMNQEAYGGPVSQSAYDNFLQYIPDWIMNQMCVEGAIHHPTFLYESLWNLGGLILLLVLRYKVNPRRGVIFLTYVIWYSFGRFFIEGLRTDSLYIVGDLRTAQLISVLLIIGAIILIIYRKQKGLANVLYDGRPLDGKGMSDVEKKNSQPAKKKSNKKKKKKRK
ncbi:prolipoprotein diacylglyceryl transferase [Halalkalibacillus sediminis]|uniref:Phosphatidylglycerol--prolipoprotein diacylglyceryl transferase n=1 Tax=Halalkalibacillus sediminis TaxID=2018042 RepID=A0A2I0QUJ1_9BACI|nr:prolipoprotein diacylglyceryl transferase [Halalkalibacillus sediminis]PKR78011.1 prolipoprotein diacylglyceryl transferase [Halalkalibacillus sediminis]